MLDFRNRRIEPRVGVEFSPRSAQRVAMRLGTGLVWSLNHVDLEVEAAYVGGSATTTGFGGDEKSIAGGPGISLRTYAGPWTLLATLGLEIRYSWQHLARPNPTRAEQAGFPLYEDRNFGSFGPRGGVRASLPLGHHLSVAAGVSLTGLFRREEASLGGTQVVFRPIFLFSGSIGYAF
jgi:hypothetical protein